MRLVLVGLAAALLAGPPAAMAQDAGAGKCGKGKRWDADKKTCVPKPAGSGSWGWNWPGAID
jgi:hypothetical protein